MGYFGSLGAKQRKEYNAVRMSQRLPRLPSVHMKRLPATLQELVDPAISLLFELEFDQTGHMLIATACCSAVGNKGARQRYELDRVFL